MADHADLVDELPSIEKMSTQERLKHAKKRRQNQLKRWAQKEKEQQGGGGAKEAKKKKTDQNMRKKAAAAGATTTKKKDGSGGFKVHFVPNIMLLEAAARGDVEEVRRLLLLGVYPDSTNEEGLTALHQCCIDNNEDMMKLLIEFGANVNAEDSEKWSPLHAAATCGHCNLVKYLISKGANLLAVNADGNMPYDICEDETTLDYIESEMSKRGVTQELIEETRGSIERLMLDDLKWIVQQNRDLEYRDHQGATPLHIAAANGYLTVVEFLLDHNVDVQAVDDDLWQPIHAAACWGHLDALEMLVLAGANLDSRTKTGETPFDICEDIEMKERMVHLKSEVEFKKSTQSQRLRRSQSQNTRSHSVRRTSIRDKTRLSRKEAVDEAKIRLQHQEIQLSDIEKMDSDMEYEGTDKENYSAPVLHLDQNSVSVRHQGGKKNVMPVAPMPRPTNSPMDWVDPLEDTKVDVYSVDGTTSKQRRSPPPVIHETFNTALVWGASNNGLGTLAELKKQRTDTRGRYGGKQESPPSTNRHSSNNSPPVMVRNGHNIHLQPNHEGFKTSPPPSPSASLRKFTGSTADEVIGAKQKHTCCVIL